ncbi:MAG: nitroreductase family protein [Micrococcales bacterium]|nr:nitroreductase family protein [Micrococcales bacterium]
MELIRAIRRRRMVRRFDPGRDVDEQTLTGLLGLAASAPSAGFSQGWDLIVLRTQEDRDAFWDSASGDRPPDAWRAGVRAAPVLVICCSSPAAYHSRYAEPDKGGRPAQEQDWPVPYWDVDTSMASLLVLLGATDAGLGSLFFGVPGPAHDAVRAAFDIPGERRIVGVIALGHEAERVRSPSLRRGRRALSDYAHDGRYAVPWPGGEGDR